MKWNVSNIGPSYVISCRGKIVAQGLTQELAEKIAAAHNAVIDMAFDSPGNVS